MNPPPPSPPLASLPSPFSISPQRDVVASTRHLSARDSSQPFSLFVRLPSLPRPNPVPSGPRLPINSIIDGVDLAGSKRCCALLSSPSNPCNIPSTFTSLRIIPSTFTSYSGAIFHQLSPRLIVAQGSPSSQHDVSRLHAIAIATLDCCPSIPAALASGEPDVALSPTSLHANRRTRSLCSIAPTHSVLASRSLTVWRGR